VTEPTFLDFPLRIDGRGRTASTDRPEHVRDLIRQVLFTDPGERVNRPDFGCGLKTLVFAPGGEVLAAATQVLVKGALQKWLADEIQVEAVDVRAEDERLVVTVGYVLRETGQRVVDVLTPEGAP
jgi:phage baseplate assembly protein W